MNSALAGALAAAIWALQQPVDKRAFRSGYDDIELLGRIFFNDRRSTVIGLCLHVANGAAFGAAYAQLRPLRTGPALARGASVALAENFALWPLARFVDRHHPARGAITRLAGNRRALAQSTWRHLLFGLVLAVCEHKLNEVTHVRQIPVTSNGHGSIEVASGAA